MKIIAVKVFQLKQLKRSLNFFRFLLFSCSCMVFIQLYLYLQFKYMIISYINVHFSIHGINMNSQLLTSSQLA